MTMSPFERWSVWLTTLGTLVTGVVYWWMKDMMTSTDPWSVINHPLQPWMLKAHILIAPLLVFSVGMITSRHIWRHYRMGVGKGRKTGLLAALTFGVLAVSGYVLQVITAETLLRAVGWLHLGLGIVYSVGVAAHWPATRGRLRKQPSTGQTRGKRPTPGLEGISSPAHEQRRRTGQRRPGANHGAGGGASQGRGQPADRRTGRSADRNTADGARAQRRRRLTLPRPAVSFWQRDATGRRFSQRGTRWTFCRSAASTFRRPPLGNTIAGSERSPTVCRTRPWTGTS